MKRFSLFLLFLFALGTFLLLKFFGPWESENMGGPLIRVYLTGENKTVHMPLEEYLVGVLAAEMPACFEEEALKAQAVAARTYALQKQEASQSAPNPFHPQSDVCINPSHCQGWLSSQEMKAKWGWLKYREYERKLRRVLGETHGLVAKFEGKLIDPVYHSTCGGRTENGAEIWTNDVPYLTSVSCALDQESPRYQGATTVPINEFLKKTEFRGTRQ